MIVCDECINDKRRKKKQDSSNPLLDVKFDVKTGAAQRVPRRPILLPLLPLVTKRAEEKIKDAMVRAIRGTGKAVPQGIRGTPKGKPKPPKPKPEPLPEGRAKIVLDDEVV